MTMLQIAELIELEYLYSNLTFKESFLKVTVEKAKDIYKNL